MMSRTILPYHFDIVKVAAISSTIALTIGGLVIYYHRLTKTKGLEKNVDDDNDDDDKHYSRLDLLPLETTWMLNSIPSVSTITFFKGTIVDKDKLKSKIEAIIIANPWLRGQLVRKKNCTFLRYLRSSDSNEVIPASIFTTVERADLHEKLSFLEIQRIARLYTVKKGAACINKDETLFKITLIVTGANSCALVVSLSHIIGDASTMQFLYRMLGDHQSAIALCPDRDFENDSKARKLPKGYDEIKKCVESIGYILGLLVPALFHRNKISLIHFKQEWIDNEKKKYCTNTNEGNSTTETTSFVSTSDIITSLVMKLFKCDIGFMAINYRNRIPSLTNQHAGNYVGLIAYQPEDFALPTLIRASLAKLYRVVSNDLRWEFLKTKAIVITNWASFYTELEFEGCKEALFLPVEAHFNVNKIFKSSPNQYSLLSSNYYTSLEDLKVHTDIFHH